MRNFLLGTAVFYLLQVGLNYSWMYGIDNNKDQISSISFDSLEVLRGTPLINVVTERCTNRMGRRVPVRKWFNCNSVQIYFSDLIFGEQTSEK